MPDDLRRAFDFLTRADMAWSRSEPTRFGTAVFDDRVPKRYDSNYLLVDELPRDATAEALAADAAAHDRRMIFFRDETVAEPSSPASGHSAGASTGTSSWCSARR